MIAVNEIKTISNVVINDRSQFFFTKVIRSLARSLAKSWLIKHANPDKVTPASYWFWLLRSFLIIFVVNIRTWKKNIFLGKSRLVIDCQLQNLTSVSWWKLWDAAKYPILLKVNLFELMTSIMLKPAQLISYPIIWSYNRQNDQGVLRIN